MGNEVIYHRHISRGRAGRGSIPRGVAAAAPTAQSAEQTVKSLQTSGYHVIVNRTGAAPLANCTVLGVRQGQTISTNDSRGGSSINTTVISKTAYVDVAC